MMPSIDKDLIISTPGRGKEVRFAPKYREEALKLKRAAKEYYYPMMALKHLAALSSGLMGKTNVFIPNIKDFKTNSFQRVVVFVPGIKATIEHRRDGSLVVTEFEMSNGYDAIAIRGDERPGVYTVKKNVRGDVDVHYKSNGRITPVDGRNVIVADTRYPSPEKSAVGLIDNLKATHSRDAVIKVDFDLFYSPVGKKLGGLRRYTPEIHTNSYGFAGLLADAMERSLKQKSVTWASELSGSVVLTQALETLALKGVSFEDKNHLVKMHGPTTSPVPTLRAAKELKMTVDSDLAKGDGHIIASVSSLLTNASRARDPNDHYTSRDYLNDLSGGTMGALAAAGAVTFAASAALNPTLLVGFGSFCSGVGALHLTYKAVKNHIKRI